MKTILSCLFMTITLFMNCENNDDDNTDDIKTDCDTVTIVDAEAYANAESDHFTIISLQIVEDCLEITFSASGCSGESWGVQLIDSEQILESFPIQRNLFFELKNEELCDAVFQQTVSFDIAELKEGYDEVILNITNADESISTNPENPVTDCDFMTVIDAEAYANAESDDFTINSVEVVEDCLEITYSASGCDGESWETRLIDSEQILESFPIQRNLVFELTDEEDCEAYITKSVTFDISALKEDDDEVILNITNADEQITF